MINRRSSRFIFTVFIVLILTIIGRVQAEVFRAVYGSTAGHVALEILDKDLLHVCYGIGEGDANITVSPMVYKVDYTGTTVENIADTESVVKYRTDEFEVSIDKVNLSITVIERSSNKALASFTPKDLIHREKTLQVSMACDEHYYGLGEKVRGDFDNSIDWRGRRREFGPFGNIMEGGMDGANANMSVPVLFSTRGYALFLDNVYKHTWDFQGANNWTVQVEDGLLRFYVMTGPNLVDLMDDYTELTGRAPLPPKTMLGLYMSEFGYDNWKELEDVRSELQTSFDTDPANDKENFPLDGFILDLQWFGGVPAVPGVSRSSMGKLTWDSVRFPDARAHIKKLVEEYGLGTILIEEAYVDKDLPEYQDLASRGFLAKSPDSSPCFIDYNPWWGKGGMIDFTNPEAGAYWFDIKHIPLIEDGIVAFWTDLGEPEMYRPECTYYGGKGHKDIHNIFNLLWSKSIAEGYARHFPDKRHFILSRSGTAGGQRYGVGFWSGDVGANERALVAQTGTMINIGLSGMPYWGTDISGFHGAGSDALYTRWFQFGAFTSIFRPHKENLCNCKPTSPALRGNKASNLFYTRLRYALGPYLYTTAREAYETGLPIMRGLVLHYENDPNVYNEGSEFLFGRELLVAPILRENQTFRSVYLPRGDEWYDFYTNVKYDGGISLKNVSGFFPGTYEKIPLYVRAGAILPMVHVDEKTMNISGRRVGGAENTPFIFRIYPKYPQGSHSYTLYEDDGATNAYEAGAFRKTPIISDLVDDELTVTISAAQGTYEGAANDQNMQLEIITGKRPEAVFLGTHKLVEGPDKGSILAGEQGWFYEESICLLYVALGNARVNQTKVVNIKGIAPCRGPEKLEVNYYGTNWSQVSIHYGLKNQAGPWTTVAMGPAQISGCLPGWRVSLPVDPMLGIDFVFTDGTNWDNNARQDYHIENANQIWVNAQAHAISTTPPPCHSNVPVHFICYNAWTNWGQDTYVVGNIKELGNWDTSKAVKLNPVTDPWQGIWNAAIDLPPDTQVEWKCIIKEPLQWQPGENNRVTTPCTGTTVLTYTSGSF
jgi:alpha-glucosidase (family GH31 glycosyl hydrolase)